MDFGLWAVKQHMPRFERVRDRMGYELEHRPDAVGVPPRSRPHLALAPGVGAGENTGSDARENLNSGPRT